MSVAFIFVLCVAQVLTEETNYEGFKVFRIFPSKMHHYPFIRRLEGDSKVNLAKTSCESQPKFVDVMVSPNVEESFKKVLKKHGINVNIMIEDVQRTIVEKERRIESNESTIWNEEIRFDKYYRYNEIQSYLLKVSLKYPEIVTLKPYGSSYENRTLSYVRISTGGNGDKKGTIFIDAGHHANEWVGPAQALYIINQLVENPNNRHLITRVDWIVAPLVNPDGYEYAHTKNRFWRRTRSRGNICTGVDPNRNYDFHWGEQGGHHQECSNFYAGPRAFSEKESLYLSKLIEQNSKRTKLYLSFHTPALCLLYPWGYTSEAPENEEDLRSLGTKVAKAVESVNGTKYLLGSSYTVLNPSAGSSRDWAYGKVGIKLAYTMELPPGGITGFDMPPERIQPVVEEMFEGVKEFHSYIESKFSSNF